MRVLILCFVLFILSASLFSQSIGELRKIFAYDKGQNSEFKIINSIDSSGCTWINIMYATTGKNKATGCLVIPQKKMRQYPVVLFLHGDNQKKEDFFKEAIEFSNLSLASLLIDALPSRPEPMQMHYFNFTEPEKDFQAYKQTIIDLRRSIDMLEKLPQIDASRIAFIGSNRGAWAGAVLSGIETRISTSILLSCTICPSCDLRYPDVAMHNLTDSLSSDQINKYITVMKSFDLEEYLANRSQNSIFFQFPAEEPVNTLPYIEKIIQSTKDPKYQKKYPSQDNLIILPEAVNDRITWLKKHL